MNGIFLPKLGYLKVLVDAVSLIMMSKKPRIAEERYLIASAWTALENMQKQRSAMESTILRVRLLIRTNLKCINVSGDCQALFLESQICRFLDGKTYQGLCKIRADNELRQVTLIWVKWLIKANLYGLVHCPFCDFAAIMEDPTDRIFGCQNEYCGEQSCRYCRVRSHHPKTCEGIIPIFGREVNIEYREQKREKTINAKHTVEEAMTAALVNICNSCGRRFLKEHGCNKMTCTCGNTQCHVCGQNAKYDHFGPTTCPLYDDAAARERREVAAAQLQTVRTLLNDRKGMNPEELTVDKALMENVNDLQAISSVDGNDLYVQPLPPEVLVRQKEQQEIERERERVARIARELNERQEREEIERQEWIWREEEAEEWAQMEREREESEKQQQLELKRRKTKEQATRIWKKTSVLFRSISKVNS